MSMDYLVYNGKNYTSIKELCIDLGVSESAIRVRMVKNMTVFEALEDYYRAKDTKSVTYKGKKYNTLTELCRELGIRRAVIDKRIKRGMSLEDAVLDWYNTLNSKDDNKVVYRNKTYNSLNSLCNAIGVNRDCIVNRLNAGFSLEDAIDDYRKRNNNKKLVYNGIEFKNLTALGNYVGIKPSTLTYIIRNCDNIENGIERHLYRKSKREFEHRGVKYNSINEFLDKHNIEYKTFYSYYKITQDLEFTLDMFTNSIVYEGITYDNILSLNDRFRLSLNTLINTYLECRDWTTAINRAMNKKKNSFTNARKCICNGVEYSSIKELARVKNVDYISLRYYINQGYSIEEAVNKCKKLI